MFQVCIDNEGGSYFDSREEAERELKRFGFKPNLVGFEKLLFTGRECKVMTARIEEVRA